MRRILLLSHDPELLDQLVTELNNLRQDFGIDVFGVKTIKEVSDAVWGRGLAKSGEFSQVLIDLHIEQAQQVLELCAFRHVDAMGFSFSNELLGSAIQLRSQGLKAKIFHEDRSDFIAEFRPPTVDREIG